MFFFLGKSSPRTFRFLGGVPRTGGSRYRKFERFGKEYNFGKSDWGPNPEALSWGWVFLEQTRILSGIQFTTYFIEIFVVEMK